MTAGSCFYPAFIYLRPPLVLRVVVPLSVLRVVVELLRVFDLLSPELSRICGSTRTGWPMEPP